jgi:LPS-assembly lipoprotein
MLLLMPLLVAGCSYRPLYGGGEQSAAVTGLRDVAIAEQKSRAGQLLRNELLEPGVGEARYILELDVTEQGKAAAGTRARVQYSVNATYRLKAASGGAVLHQGKTYASVFFDTVREPLADLQAENSARQRAVQELAQDMRLRLSAVFARKP